MIRLVHGSDVHFGKPHLSRVAESFADAVRGHEPDLLVISGDLTQRAKSHEYEAAAGWLSTFAPIPVVTTPGNHDVPLYRVFERAFDPYRNWRRSISTDLDSVTRIDGMTVVALNSAAPHTAIVNGRISEAQLDYARRAFAAAPAGDVKIVVTHHHMISAPDPQPDHPLPGAVRLLDAFAEMGAELTLGGHLHRAYHGVWFGGGSEPPHRLLSVHAGTTTSSRGRAREKGRNSYNLIEVDADRITVIPHLLYPDDVWRPMSRHTFPRPHHSSLTEAEGSVSETGA